VKLRHLVANVTQFQKRCSVWPPNEKYGILKLNISLFGEFSLMDLREENKKINIDNIQILFKTNLAISARSVADEINCDNYNFKSSRSSSLQL
jgi:hypothetical protein